MMKLPALFATLVLGLATACQPAPASTLRGHANDTNDTPPDGDGTADPPTAPAKTPPKGATPPATSGTTAPSTPGNPAKPLDPNGFTAKVAPLLEAQGCTECHHAGRPIDLTKYPFMAGSDKDITDRLTRSLAASGTMPPAPRDRAPASLGAAIATWQAAGAKP